MNNRVGGLITSEEHRQEVFHETTLRASKMYGHLVAHHFNRKGKLKDICDLGYGTVTNVGVMAMCNDAFWASPSGAAINTLCLAKYMATGTGATASAATDISLQTADGIASVTGVQTLVSAANTQKLQVVGTQNYTATESVTEWGLFTAATLSATTGTPWTAGSATTGTVTGTPFTASSTTVQGQQQNIFIDTTKSPNIYILCASNTSSVITGPAWYNTTNGNAAGTFPANTDALTSRPVMLDHLVFTSIGVVNGDSIQFTFQLTLPSGS